MLMPSILTNNFFDDLFDDFVEPARNFAPATTSTFSKLMKTDIKEHENGFDLAIELPGYRKEDVNAELKDGYLIISAQTTKDNDEKDEHGRYIRRERYSGNCQRSFYVGENITEEDIKAKFENGILNLTIPKKEEQPKAEEKKYIAIEG
ncbi:MAG: Hsp20/alpha crystallin family protein [Acetatifactor sp.]|nr:Hsp20/alpha crystallin family protein [Acetatifactor sp.]